MTDATTPIQTVFEMQRQSIEHGQQLLEQSLALQQNAAETFLRNGLAAQRSVQGRGTEFAHELTNAQFEAYRAALADDQYDVQSAVDEAFEAFTESQHASWEEFETTFGEAVDDLTDQQQALVAQTVQAVLDAQRDVERQTVEGTRRTQEVTQAARKQGDESAQSVQESAEKAAAAAADAADQQVEAHADAADESLETIDGLGPTYADRLRDQGIESLPHLARADVETVAAAADVSQARAEEWTAAARTRT